MHKAGSIGAHIAETLDDYSRLVSVHAEPLKGLVTDDHQSTPGSFSASMGAAQFERLPGDHSRDRMAHMHGVGIHDPGHDLLVRINVRTGNIFFRTQDLHELRSVPSGESLEFTLGQVVWIANHPTSGTTERDIHQSTFPCHPTCECSCLVKRELGAVRDTTLGWSAIEL